MSVLYRLLGVLASVTMVWSLVNIAPTRANMAPFTPIVHHDMVVSQTILPPRPSLLHDLKHSHVKQVHPSKKQINSHKKQVHPSKKPINSHKKQVHHSKKPIIQKKPITPLKKITPKRGKHIVSSKNHDKLRIASEFALKRKQTQLNKNKLLRNAVKKAIVLHSSVQKAKQQVALATLDYKKAQDKIKEAQQLAIKAKQRVLQSALRKAQLASNDMKKAKQKLHHASKELQKAKQHITVVKKMVNQHQTDAKKKIQALIRSAVQQSKRISHHEKIQAVQAVQLKAEREKAVAVQRAVTITRTSLKEQIRVIQEASNTKVDLEKEKAKQHILHIKRIKHQHVKHKALIRKAVSQLKRSRAKIADLKKEVESCSSDFSKASSCLVCKTIIHEVQLSPSCNEKEMCLSSYDTHDPLMQPCVILFESHCKAIHSLYQKETKEICSLLAYC